MLDVQLIESNGDPLAKIGERCYTMDQLVEVIANTLHAKRYQRKRSEKVNAWRQRSQQALQDAKDLLSYYQQRFNANASGNDEDVKKADETLAQLEKREMMGAESTQAILVRLYPGVKEVTFFCPYTFEITRIGSTVTARTRKD